MELSVAYHHIHFPLYNCRRNTKWTEYVWYTENWMSSIRKEDPPHKFVINKGSAHIVACRSFVDYVLNDRRAQDLLDWMRDVRVPDEHYFATLNHNPTRGVPGAYTGEIRCTLSYVHTGETANDLYAVCRPAKLLQYSIKVWYRVTQVWYISYVLS